MFNPEFQNRDSNTHLESSWNDLSHFQEPTEWEKDFINYFLLEEELKIEN